MDHFRFLFADSQLRRQDTENTSWLNLVRKSHAQNLLRFSENFRSTVVFDKK